MSTHTFKPIVLGEETKSRRNSTDWFLEPIAAAFMEPTTFITSPSKAMEKVRKRRERTRTSKKELGKVNREILTRGIEGVGAVLLGATGAGRSVVKTVIPKMIPKTISGMVGATTGVGILVSSKVAREHVSGYLKDPTRIGIEAGKLLDKAVADKDLPDISDVLKTGGAVGLGILGGKWIYDKFHKKKNKHKTPDVDKTPFNTPTSGALPTDRVPGPLEPISDVPVVEPAKEVNPLPSTPDINIKVINKPQINLAQAQSI